MVVRFMREYILTDKERREIKKYLKDGKATNLIYVIRSRSSKALGRLREDLEYLEELVKG
jgi:DNA primase catalytic subunit